MSYDNWKTTNRDDEQLGPEPEEWAACEECRSEGTLEIPEPMHDDPYRCRIVVCEFCGGSGYVRCKP